ncbi:MAG: hypothetical protein AAF138_06665 [Planctomycetota bacterium]
MNGERRKPVVLLGCTLSLWLGVAIVLWFVTPRLEAVFVDFGVALPILATATIEASRWLRGAGPGAALPGIVFAGPVYAAALIVPSLSSISAPRARWPRLSLALLALACGLALLFLAVSLGAPYLRLLEALAEQP